MDLLIACWRPSDGLNTNRITGGISTSDTRPPLLLSLDVTAACARMCVFLLCCCCCCCLLSTSQQLRCKSVENLISQIRADLHRVMGGQLPLSCLEQDNQTSADSNSLRVTSFQTFFFFFFQRFCPVSCLTGASKVSLPTEVNKHQQSATNFFQSCCTRWRRKKEKKKRDTETDSSFFFLTKLCKIPPAVVFFCKHGDKTTAHESGTDQSRRR